MIHIILTTPTPPPNTHPTTLPKKTAQLRNSLRWLAILFWTSTPFPIGFLILAFLSRDSIPIAIIILILIIPRSFMGWRFTHPLPGETTPHSRWRRLARCTALLQPAALLLSIAAAFLFMMLKSDSLEIKNGVFLSIFTAIALATLISHIINGLLQLSLLAYAAQLACQSGHRVRLARVSAFLVSLPQWIWCVLLALMLAAAAFAGFSPFSIARGDVDKMIAIGPFVLTYLLAYFLILPLLLAELLTTAWTGVVLWLVSNRINRPADHEHSQ